MSQANDSARALRTLATASSVLSKAILEVAADCLDQKEAENKRLQKQVDGFWEHLHNAFDIESRAEIEEDAKDNWNPPNPLVAALHYIWKRNPKVVDLLADNKRLREALKETRLLWTKIFLQYKSRQHQICNQAAKLIDEALKDPDE